MHRRMPWVGAGDPTAAAPQVVGNHARAGDTQATDVT